LLLAQFAFDYPVRRWLQGEFEHHDVDGNIALLAPLLIPIAVALYRASGRAALGLLFGAAALAIAAFGPMLAAAAALLCAGLAFLLAAAWPRGGLAFVFLILAGYAAAAPLISSAVLTPAGLEELGIVLPDHWALRVGMWTLAAQQGLDHFWTGVGFRNARHLAEQMLHPHNAVLEIWVELGVVGIFGLGAVLFGIFRGLRALARQDRLGAAAGAAAFVTYAVIALLSFSLWQTWWYSTAWLTAFAVLVLARSGAEAREPGPAPA